MLLNLTLCKTVQDEAQVLQGLCRMKCHTTTPQFLYAFARLACDTLRKPVVHAPWQPTSPNMLRNFVRYFLGCSSLFLNRSGANVDSHSPRCRNTFCRTGSFFAHKFDYFCRGLVRHCLTVCKKRGDTYLSHKEDLHTSKSDWQSVWTLSRLSARVALQSAAQAIV